MADSSFAVDSPPPKIPIRSTKVENGMQTTIEADVMQQEDDDDDDDDEEEAPPARLPAVRHQVRSSDRIILRVESFRTMQSSPARTSTPPAPAVQRPHPVRNNTYVKRVSSSTQTELSVLKPTSGNNHNNFGKNHKAGRSFVPPPPGTEWTKTRRTSVGSNMKEVPMLDVFLERLKPTYNNNNNNNNSKSRSNNSKSLKAGEQEKEIMP